MASVQLSRDLLEALTFPITFLNVFLLSKLPILGRIEAQLWSKFYPLFWNQRGIHWGNRLLDNSRGCWALVKGVWQLELQYWRFTRKLFRFSKPIALKKKITVNFERLQGRSNKKRIIWCPSQPQFSLSLHCLALNTFSYTDFQLQKPTTLPGGFLWPQSL